MDRVEEHEHAHENNNKPPRLFWHARAIWLAVHPHVLESLLWPIKVGSAMYTSEMAQLSPFEMTY
jgi:hypothetical protein